MRRPLAKAFASRRYSTESGTNPRSATFESHGFVSRYTNHTKTSTRAQRINGGTVCRSNQSLNIHGLLAQLWRAARQPASDECEKIYHAGVHEQPTGGVCQDARDQTLKYHSQCGQLARPRGYRPPRQSLRSSSSSKFIWGIPANTAFPCLARMVDRQEGGTCSCRPG